MSIEAAAEARHLLRQVRARYPAGTPWKVIAPRVASGLGVTARRIAALWRGEARRIDADELDRLRMLAASIEKASHARDDLARRIAALEFRLDAIGEDGDRAGAALDRNGCRAGL